MSLEAEMCRIYFLISIVTSCVTAQDARWAKWGPWTPCDKPCDYGLKRRYRGCLPSSGMTCSDTDVELCTTGIVCSQMNSQDARPTENEFEPEWLQWENWSSCTVTCGGGMRRRIKRCREDSGSGTSCIYTAAEGCNPQSCSRRERERFDRGTLSWEPWSTCTASCGGGSRTRYKRCPDGSCMQNESESCNQISCAPRRNPGRSGLSWESWSACTASCGGGSRTRYKRCPDGSCMETESESCNQISCAPRAPVPDARWSRWNEWRPCSTQCGQGVQIRNRQCRGFGSCAGRNREERNCFERSGCTPVTTPQPTFLSWSAWSQCSKTCGRGEESRTRVCFGSRTQCTGETSQTRQCNRRRCVSPVWSKWTAWSKCSASCDEGMQSRERTCSVANSCAGQSEQNRPCTVEKCVVESEWSEWGYWSKCSKTCGRGVVERTRSCIVGDLFLLCEGKHKETESCFVKNCPVKDPEWSKWGDWSKCSTTCGRGERERTRSCNNKTAKSSCRGKDNEIESCVIRECPTEAPKWSDWEEWSKCSATCGDGQRERIRRCMSEDTNNVCEGRRKQVENCKVKDCIAERWSFWSTWTKCYPATPCGSPGWKVRTRTCIGGKAGVGNCAGMQKGYEQCVNECPAKWDKWETWSQCSASCGAGNRSRTRSCKSGKCTGDKSESEECNVRKCPPEWSNWENWSQCSTSCGEGRRGRVRTCRKGSRETTGCPGRKTMTEGCNVKECSPEWNDWGEWSLCTTSCGKGMQERYRTCNNQTLGCNGTNTDTKECSIGDCPLSEWSTWTSWTTCSTMCGLGIKNRTRTCNGNDCKGTSSESEKCIGVDCKLPTSRTPETKSAECQEVQKVINGAVSITKERGGTKLTFACDGGFELKGASEIFCNSNGIWSNQPPFCIAKTCFKIDQRIEKGRTCKKSCRSADQCIGLSNDCICDDVCGKSCFDPGKVICDIPEKPENGNVQFDSRAYGHYCKYSCLPGYVLSGQTERRCRSDGKWSGSAAKCFRFNTCGQAGDIGGIFNVGIVGARVLAGTAARTGAWPWQVMITVNSENDVRKTLQNLKGGGSVINNKWILTAAHIFDPMVLKSRPNGRGYLIILGMTAIDISFKLPDHARIFEPELLIVHPRFRHAKKNFDYDISLIKVGKQYKTVEQKFMYSTALPYGEITFSNHIRSVCLPCVRGTSLNEEVRKSMNRGDLCQRKDKPLEDSKDAVVTGFGRLGERSQRARILQQGLLKITNNNVCRNAAKKIKEQWPQAVFTSRMLCASSGRDRVNVDACTGDSGGPLVKKVTTSNGTEYWVQEGIVSWGFGCGRVDNEGRAFPGYYTKLSSVMPFIVNSLKTDSP